MRSLELHSISSNKSCFVCFAYEEGKEFVFRFIIKYSSLRDFYRPLGNNNNNRSIFIIWGFLKDDILGACVETWD